LKELITASDHGVIYVWRLPEALATQLNDIKNKTGSIDDDFNFEIAEPQEEQKNAVIDVLAQINKASSLIHNLTPT